MTSSHYLSLSYFYFPLPLRYYLYDDNDVFDLCFSNLDLHGNHEYQSLCKTITCILFLSFYFSRSCRVPSSMFRLSLWWLIFICHCTMYTFYTFDYLWYSSLNLHKGCTTDKRIDFWIECQFFFQLNFWFPFRTILNLYLLQVCIKYFDDNI